MKKDEPIRVPMFVIAVILALLFGFGPLKGCIPDGCQRKSETEQRYERLQEQLNN